MPSGGRDFLRLMNDQSRRAADFDRRMRWTWMRRDLRDAGPADDQTSSGDDQTSSGDDQTPAEEVVDLRPIVERAEPPQRD